MKRKINFLTKKNKIKKNILSDIINFQKIHYNNEISILPDIHQKKEKCHQQAVFWFLI